MPLVNQLFSNQLFAFIQGQQAATVADPAAAMKLYCDVMEKLVYQAIISHQLTILPGSIVVIGNQFTQTNPAPIVLGNGGLAIIN